jgi:hypothetical protein
MAQTATDLCITSTTANINTICISLASRAQFRAPLQFFRGELKCAGTSLAYLCHAEIHRRRMKFLNGAIHLESAPTRFGNVVVEETEWLTRASFLRIPLRERSRDSPERSAPNASLRLSVVRELCAELMPRGRRADGLQAPLTSNPMG